MYITSLITSISKKKNFGFTLYGSSWMISYSFVACEDCDGPLISYELGCNETSLINSVESWSDQERVLEFGLELMNEGRGRAGISQGGGACKSLSLPNIMVLG